MTDFTLPITGPMSDGISSLLKSVPQDQNEFVYKKFKDAKKQIEDVYIEIAFKNSKDGQALIKTVLEAIKK